MLSSTNKGLTIPLIVTRRKRKSKATSKPTKVKAKTVKNDQNEPQTKKPIFKSKPIVSAGKSPKILPLEKSSFIQCFPETSKTLNWENIIPDYPPCELIRHLKAYILVVRKNTSFFLGGVSECRLFCGSPKVSGAIISTDRIYKTFSTDDRMLYVQTDLSPDNPEEIVRILSSLGIRVDIPPNIIACVFIFNRISETLISKLHINKFNILPYEINLIKGESESNDMIIDLWEYTFRRVSEEGARTIMIYSHKHAETSQYITFLINSLISRKKRVVLMDCDQEKPFFGKPAQISLYSIKDFVFGDENSDSCSCLLSLFLGSYDLFFHSDRYHDSVKFCKFVYDHYLSSDDTILVINSPNYNAYVGFVEDLILLSKADLFVCIDDVMLTSCFEDIGIRGMLTKGEDSQIDCKPKNFYSEATEALILLFDLPNDFKTKIQEALQNEYEVDKKLDDDILSPNELPATNLGSNEILEIANPYDASKEDLLQNIFEDQAEVIEGIINESDSFCKDSIRMKDCTLRIDSKTVLISPLKGVTGYESTTSTKIKINQLIKLMSYFSTCPTVLPQDFANNRLDCMIPYELKLSETIFSFFDELPSSGELKHAFRLNVVGLLFDPLFKQEFIQSVVVDEGIELKCYFHSPYAHCLGLGFIRQIDSLNDSLFIVTPLSQDMINKINVVALGNLEMPTSLLDDHQLDFFELCISISKLRTFLLRIVY
ncbi:Polynucleotide 5'-hydroxyl-kinase NOL9 [Thelohanellus kitauei]|uniref:Polynucleotide 5'-hydroxyl-kinase NOL9 n=1 Tax=Thelohanellus kitauei TaxID=669202 RepID=A0A0C2N9Y3_THEKT|nr:Polynucleotide 5'-hydroxyl-kinase NOL9 [Thelohanellus kitauei]